LLVACAHDLAPQLNEVITAYYNLASPFE
jgi:hypothetical protein